MNEELRIIIRTITTEAEKNLKEIKKQLGDVKKSGEDSGNSVDNAMKAVAKGAAIAVGSVIALTAAMEKLGKSAQDLQKGFDKLNTTFLNAGSTTKQASDTYKELFSFLGDHDKAIETAQSLALITNEEQKLSEWTHILQGAFSEMGDKLPIEGLAEAANETVNTGKVVGVMADALTWAKISEDGFNEALAKTTSLSEREALVRNTLNGLYGNSAKIYDANAQATINQNRAQAELNIKMAQLSAYLTPLLTSITELGSAFLTTFGPAIETVSIYLTAFIQLLAEAIAWVGNFFGVVSSQGGAAAADVEGYQRAVAEYQAKLRKAFGGTNNELEDNLDNINKVKKAVMGFDELNVVSSQSTTSSTTGGGGGGGIGPLPVAPDPSDYGIGTGGSTELFEMSEKLASAKDTLKQILAIASTIGIAIGGWKLIEIVGNLFDSLATTKQLRKWIKATGVDIDDIWNNLNMEESSSLQHLESMKQKAKAIGGQIMAIAGAALLVSGYLEGWGSGVDWTNLIAMLAGVALAIGGIVLAYGKIPALYASVVAGVALVILAIKDIIENGFTVENVIALIAGALAVIIPLVYAFNTALASNPIGLVATAVAALLAGIIALTAEFINEEKAIKSVEDAKNSLKAATEAALDAKVRYTNAVDAAEEALIRLKEAEEAVKMSGEELYNAVENGTITYSELTEAQQELYKAYLNNKKAQGELESATEALSEAKRQEVLAAFDVQLANAKVSGSYDEYKKAVIDAYNEGTISAEDARDAIGKSMSEMSRDAQKAFMTDIPDAIKDGLDPKNYETSGQKLGKFFGGLWDNLNKAFSQGFSITGGWGFIMPAMATGGIVNGPTTALIGEAGREAVLPLENNTGWMDTLADRIASRNGSPTKIVLELDGKELGYASINSINSITRQTGNLQLQLI